MRLATSVGVALAVSFLFYDQRDLSEKEQGGVSGGVGWRGYAEREYNPVSAEYRGGYGMSPKRLATQSKRMAELSEEARTGRTY